MNDSTLRHYEIQAELLPLSAIAPSETHIQQRRRKRYTEESLDELAATLRTPGGLLEPILVRRLDALRGLANHEIIAGERRWRAAQRAGWGHIPAIVRIMSDAEVLEAQLVENLQREGLDDLEQAEGFQELRDHGYSIEDISVKVGLKRSQIYARLQLLEASPAVQEAMQSGQLDLTKAGEVAKVKGEKQQQRALKLALTPGMSARDLREHLSSSKFTVQLGEAPFALDAQGLHPDRGPCTTCPDRSGNCHDFDAAKDDPNLCTNPPCYEVKLYHWGDQRRKQIEAAGGRVLTGPTAAAIAPRAGVLVGHVDLDERCYYDVFPEPEPEDQEKYADWAEREAAWQSRTYRVLLNQALQDGEDLNIVVLEDRKRLRELVPVDRARRLLKRLKIELGEGVGEAPAETKRAAPKSESQLQREAEAENARREREEQESRFRVAVLEAIHAKWKGPLKREDWEAIAEAICDAGGHGNIIANALHAGNLSIGKLSERDLQRLCVECTVAREVGWPGYNPGPLFALARRLKIDPAKIKADLQRGGKPAPAKAKAKAKKKGGKR